MSKQYKPEGYSSVSPYFVVNGAQKLIDQLKKVFDVEQLRKYELPDGKIVHTEIKIDDSVIMLADSNEEYPPSTQIIHIYVPDVHSVYKKALEAGFEPMQEPVQKDDPDIRGMFKDFQGNIWTVSTQA